MFQKPTSFSVETDRVRVSRGARAKRSRCRAQILHARATTLASLASFVVGVAPLSSTSGQVRLSASPSCSDCRIELQRLVRLDLDRDPDGKKPLPAIRELDRARLVVWDGGSRPEVFFRDGRRIHATGSDIEAPRLGGALRIEVSDSSRVHVFGMAGRAAVFDGDGRFIRTYSLPGPVFSSSPVTDQVFALNIVSSSEDLAGIPLVAVRADGHVLGAFGSVDSVYRFDRTIELRRTVARAMAGSLFASPLLSLRLERWQLSGYLINTYQRSPDIGALGDSRLTGTQSLPFVRALSVDKGGRVWVVLSIPRFTDQEKGDTSTGFRDEGVLIHSRIEIFDLGRRQLLAGIDLPFEVLDFAGPGLLASYRRTATERYLEIWRVELQT